MKRIRKISLVFFLSAVIPAGALCDNPPTRLAADSADFAENTDQAVMRANSLAQDGRYEEALDLYTEAVVRMQYQEGVYALSQIDLLPEMARIAEILDGVRGIRAERLMEFRLRMAEGHYNSEDPLLVAYYVEAGHWELEHAHYRKAEKVFHRGLSLNQDIKIQDKIALLEGLALSLMQQGSDRSALEVIKQVSEMAAQDGALDIDTKFDKRLQYADLLMLLHKYDKAYAAYEEIWLDFAGQDLSFDLPAFFNHPTPLGFVNSFAMADSYGSLKEFRTGAGFSNFQPEGKTISIPWGNVYKHDPTLKKAYGFPFSLCSYEVGWRSEENLKKRIDLDLSFSVRRGYALLGPHNAIFLDKIGGIKKLLELVIRNTVFRPPLEQGKVQDKSQFEGRETLDIRQDDQSIKRGIVRLTSSMVKSGCTMIESGASLQ